MVIEFEDHRGHDWHVFLARIYNSTAKKPALCNLIVGKSIERWCGKLGEEEEGNSINCVWLQFKFRFLLSDCCAEAEEKWSHQRHQKSVTASCRHSFIAVHGYCGALHFSNLFTGLLWIDVACCRFVCMWWWRTTCVQPANTEKWMPSSMWSSRMLSFCLHTCTRVFYVLFVEGGVWLLQRHSKFIKREKISSAAVPRLFLLSHWFDSQWVVMSSSV